MDFYEQNLIGRVVKNENRNRFFFKKLFSLDFSGCEQDFPKIQQSASPN